VLDVVGGALPLRRVLVLRLPRQAALAGLLPPVTCLRQDAAAERYDVLSFSRAVTVFLLAVWRSGGVRRSSPERSYSILFPVSTGMGDRLVGGYTTSPTMLTQPCIPLGR